MNKNLTAVILIVLAVGIYFTFTRAKIDELKVLAAANKEYQVAIDNAEKLIQLRDEVLKSYNEISEGDKDRLNKIVPDHVDNVHLIIDVKDDIAARHGLFLRNLKTSSTASAAAEAAGRPGGLNETGGGAAPSAGGDKYGVVTLSFNVTATYDQFMNFLKDLESSLRILDISKLTLTGNQQGTYDFSIELKTYWLK